MAAYTLQQTFDLAVQHHKAGRLSEAEQIYRQIIEVEPRHADSLHLLGVISYQSGRPDLAIDLIRRALAFNPEMAEAYSNLGNAHKASAEFDQAIAAYRQALAIRFDYPQAHNNLGTALSGTGQLDEAVASFRQALVFNPDYPEAHYNLGTTLRYQGQLDEAVAELQHALALKPDYLHAQNNLGNALRDKGQLGQAIAAYRQALRIEPDFAEGHSNLLFTLQYYLRVDAKAIAEEQRLWAHHHAEPLKQFIQPYANNRNPDRPLRIGYVSPDLGNHPVGWFLLPLLADHDRKNFEVFCFAQVVHPDSFADRLRDQVDQWIAIAGLSDHRVAELIRAAQIDILVDLSLHSKDNRLLLFARKPAPVQVTYLAYPGSSGLTTMDYRLSDPYLDPPGSDESLYSEKTLRLPDTYWCYQPLSDPAIGPSPALTNRFITFGCLNDFCKVNESVLAAWAQILNATPNSQLLLHAHVGNHHRRVLDQLEHDGIDPSRISFVGRVSTDLYFQQYQSIDIALDTFPYAGGTTTCDSLWMGVPVVSVAGQRAVGRGGLSILSNVGLPELVASDRNQYAQIAIDLALDQPRLCTLRSTLRDRMRNSALMDGTRFARNLESLYRQIWRNWCQRNPTCPQ